MKRLIRSVSCLILVFALAFICGTSPAYARGNGYYYGVTENTCDDEYCIILLGGGGDNKVFKNGEDFGKVSEEHIRDAVEEGKINVLAGHSTGANQVQHFVTTGCLEDVIDMFVPIDGNGYYEDVLCARGDTQLPVLIFMSSQMNRINSYVMKQHYSNFELFQMRGTRHVNIVEEHFHELVGLIHDYYDRQEAETNIPLRSSRHPNEDDPQNVDVSVKKIWEEVDDPFNKIPISIEIALFDGDEQVGEQRISPDKDGNWIAVFENLPNYRDGKIIKYFAVERNIEWQIMHDAK